MSEHVCRLNDPWPTGHPLPPEDPAKVQGPEEGTFMMYHDMYAEKKGAPAYVVVKVLRRSYVWSPGECRHKGGYRHYDWSVIERGPGRYRSVIVNDSDLSPLPRDAFNNEREAKVITVYAVRF
jgi:hypothetical protein